MVFLHGARRDGIDTGRYSEPLELGDDRGLGVLRDHVPRIDARIVGEERRQPVAATGVKKRSVRRSDMLATSATRIARKSRAWPTGAPWKLPLDSTRPSSSTTGLSTADASSREAIRRVWSSVSRAAPVTCGEHLQRVRVLDHRAVGTAVTCHDGRAREDAAQVGRAGHLSRMRPQGLEVFGENPVRPQQRLDAHRRGDVGDLQQFGEVGLPGSTCRACRRSVDQGKALLGGQLDRL